MYKVNADTPGSTVLKSALTATLSPAPGTAPVLFSILTSALANATICARSINVIVNNFFIFR